VFTSLWRNREKTEIISLDAYLATATKYTVLAKIKQRERYNLYRAGLNQGRSLYGELQAESAVHYGRILELAKKEIDKLPERCRLIFNYHRFEGKSARQIADLMNISQKTVENQLNKAVNRLKVVARTLLHSVFFLVPLSIILPCIKAFRVIC
jgi:RNA polymerase sigma-70 factor (ECF subfamily)